MEQLKVEYVLPSGHTSDAYIDKEREDQDICRGTDRHTDARVVVRWTGERWVQLPPY